MHILITGADALNRVMTDGVPDTFFPSSMPFTTRDGYTVQVAQDVCAAHSFITRQQHARRPSATLAA
jgi:hypothetical protein